MSSQQPSTPRGTSDECHRTRHDRPGPRLLGHAPELGGLDRPLRGQGLHRARPGLSRLRGRGRGAQRRSDPDRRPPGARRSSSTSRRSSATLDRRRSSSGHSAGGAFTQILLDHGYGAAGVAINSAPTEGVQVVPATQIKSTFPVLKNPANHHKAVGLHARAVDVRVHQHLHRGAVAGDLRALPRSRRRVGSCGTACSPTSSPATRAPGSTTRTTTGRRCCSSRATRTTSCRRAIQQSNAKHYKSDTITEIKEFEGPHLLPMADGWEEVADYALEWALEHAVDAADPA